MKEFIVCSKGRRAVVIVDDDVYEVIKDYNFYTKPKGAIFTKSTGYEKSLGRIIMGRKEGFVVDHIDRDKNNNLRSNLRFATKYTQAANSGLQKNNKTGYTGVGLDKRTGYYFACLKHEGQAYFDYNRHATAEEAALAYNRLVKKLNSAHPLHEIIDPVHP